MTGHQPLEFDKLMVTIEETVGSSDPLHVKRQKLVELAGASWDDAEFVIEALVSYAFMQKRAADHLLSSLHAAAVYLDALHSYASRPLVFRPGPVAASDAPAETESKEPA